MNQPVLLNRALSEIKALHPDWIIQSIQMPVNTDQSMRSVWSNSILPPLNQNQQNQIFFSDPESGAILADTDSIRAVVFSWILKIHRGTLAGVSGKIFMSILGILLSLLWPTGVLIHLRKAKHPRQPWLLKKNKTHSLNFHRSAGFCGGLLISTMGLSGSLINFNKDLIQALDPSPVDPMGRFVQKEPNKNPSPPSLAALDQAISQASAARLNIQLQSIHFPKAPETEILFYFKDNSRVYLDPTKNRITQVMSPKSSWIHTLYPVHSGRILGNSHPLLSWTIGILLLGLVATGFRKSKAKSLNNQVRLIISAKAACLSASSLVPNLAIRRKLKSSTVKLAMTEPAKTALRKS